MKKGKTLILLLTILILTLASGCSTYSKSEDTEKFHVTLVNNSQIPVYEISYTMPSQSGGGINADESEIGHGENLTFSFHEVSGSAVWSVLDEEKNTIVSKTIPFTFDERGEMILSIEENEKDLDILVQTP